MHRFLGSRAVSSVVQLYASVTCNRRFSQLTQLKSMAVYIRNANIRLGAESNSGGTPILHR